MKRIRLTVSYDGTLYHGWQIQENAVTIEEKVRNAVKALTNEDVEIVGGSRTDAGVHALGNIAVFDTKSPIPGDKFSYALNKLLPEDIRIVKSEEVDSQWHPRHVNTKKTYEYRIYSAEFPNPMKRLYSFYTYRKFDVKLMQEAAKYFVGEHDFKSFCAAGSVCESTVRTIYSLSVNKENENEIIIRVCGNGFLYNMVRIIAGTLMEVGQGKINPDEIPTVIKACDRQAAGPTAVACGLTLIGYEFEL